MPSRLLRLLPCLAALALSAAATAAHANTISGVAYCNISAADAANTPAPGATPSGSECATFTASELVFYNNNASTNNLGSFLNSYGEVIGSVNYLNGFDGTANLDNSFFQFTGTGYFVQGQTYNAWHDDGTVMNVGGTTVVNSPGVTAPIDTTFVFNATTGNYDFTYDYTEQYGGSTFGTDAATDPVPEPTSLLLLATGGASLYFLVRNSATRLASREFLP